VIILGSSSQDPQKPAAPSPIQAPQDPKPQPQAAPSPIGTPPPAVDQIAQERQRNFARFDQEAAQEERDLVTSLRLASQGDPDMAGEAQRIAKQLGVAPELATQNLDVARTLVKERAMKLNEMRKNSPVLWGMLEKVPFQRVAVDDLDNLRSTEGTFESMGRNIREGQLGNEANYIGLRQALGLATQAENDRADEIDMLMASAPQSEGFVGNAMEIAGQMSQTLPLSLIPAGAGAAGGSVVPGVGTAAGFTTGLALGTFTVSGALQAGGAYRQLTKRGVPRDIALPAAFGEGALVGGLEAFAGNIASAPFKVAVRSALARGAAATLTKDTAKGAFAQFVKDYAKTWAAETGTELVQDVASHLVQNAAASGVPGAKEGEDLGSTLWATFEKVGSGMAVLSLPGPSARFMADGIRARETQQKTKAFLDIAAQAEASKVKGRNSDAYSETVTAMGEKHGVGSVFVDAKELRNVLSQSDKKAVDEAAKMSGADPEQMARDLPVDLKAETKMAKLLPDVAKQLADGVELVKIPSGDFAAKLVGTEEGAALAPHVKFDEDGMSPAEAAQFEKDAPGALKEMQKEAEKLADADEQIRAEANAIEDELQAQIVAAGVEANQARTNAKLMTDSIVTLANSAGMSPKALFESERLRVNSGETVPVKSYGQDGALKTGTPEFKAWFGESKVVDEKGAPLVVYHGTANDFTEFKMGAGKAIDSGVYGSGYYFGGAQLAGVYAESSAKRKGGTARGARTIPVYLSLQKPFMLDDTGDRVGQFVAVARKIGRADLVDGIQSYDPAIESASITEALMAAGYDGVVAGNYNEVVAFDPAQIKSVNNRGTFDPNDPNILRQGGEGSRGAFDPRTLTITLLQKRDASTLMHEFAHYYLEVLGRLAANPKATERVKADFSTLMAFAGVKDAAAWESMDMKARDSAHEKVAYSFEGYLYDGKAPTKALESVFARIRTWMLRVYKSVRGRINDIYKAQFGEDLPALTPEVRQVFDRMLASQEDIDAQMAMREMSIGFQSKEEALAAGVTEEQWADVQALEGDAREEAITELQVRSLKDGKWVQNASARQQATLNAQEKEARKSVRSEEEAAVRALPVYRVQKWLKTGRMDAEDGSTTQGEPDANHKLDTEAIPEADREKLRGMLALDGQHPDTVAGFFGDVWGSGEEMVRAILAAEPIDDVVEARTDARMLAEYGDLVDPKARRLAVAEAIHNETRAKALATQLMALSKSTQPVRVMIAAAREAARNILARTAVRDLSPTRFMASEARAAKAVRDALKKADNVSAVAAQRSQLVQNQLVKLSIEATRAIGKQRRSMAEVFGADGKIAKKRDLDYVLAARAILSSYGLAGAKKTLPLEWLEGVRENDPTKYEELDGFVREATNGNTLQDYRNLTYEQWGVLNDTITTLWWKAKRENEIESMGEKIGRDEAIGLMLARGIETMGAAPDTSVRRVVQDKERRSLTLAGGAVWLKRVEFWARQMDGGQADGPFTRFLFRPLRDRVSVYHKERGKLFEAVAAKAKTLRGLDSGKIETPFPGIVDGKQGRYVFKNKGELLGALLQTGTESNLRNLLIGNGWAKIDQNGNVDARAWDAFVDDMIEKGHLTMADFTFAQAIWDLNNKELRPQAQKVNHDLNGVYFETIKSRPVVNRLGAWDGGYMPSRPDPEQTKSAGITQREGLSALGEASRMASGMMNTGATPGFTQKRKAGAIYPRIQDVRLQLQHIDEALRFIHLQPAIKDVSTLLRSQRLSSFLNGVDPTAIDELLIPWLTRTQQNRVETPIAPIIDIPLRFLRRSTGIARMFLNLPNALQQLTGFGNSSVYVKGSKLRAAAWRYMTTPGTLQSVTDRSAFMASRLGNQDGDARRDIEQMLDPSLLGKANKFTDRYGFILQRAMQNQVDVVTWLGAFDQAMDAAEAGDTKAEAKAISAADSAVRMSQGSSDAADVARYEASNTVIRLLTQFQGYWNTVWNQIASADSSLQGVSIAMRALVIPAAVSSAIVSLLAGEKLEDDDGDGWLLDEFAKWFFMSQLKASTALVPGGSIVASMFDSRPGERASVAPAFQVGKDAIDAAKRAFNRVAGDGDPYSGGDIRDAFTALGMVPGAQLLAAFGKPASYQADVAEGNIRPTGPLDYARGLVTGRAAEGTK